jgi:predicted transcriptional regulator
MESIDLTIHLPADVHAALRALASRESRTEVDLAVSAIRLYVTRVLEAESPIGALRDDADLLDTVTREAFESRERDPLRASSEDHAA